VHENQPVVCTLHRGISAGLAEAAPGRARLSRFVARDPDEAGCLIEIERLRNEAAVARKARNNRASASG
jgi:hypothetical protein